MKKPNFKPAGHLLAVVVVFLSAISIFSLRSQFNYYQEDSIGSANISDQPPSEVIEEQGPDYDSMSVKELYDYHQKLKWQLKEAGVEIPEEELIDELEEDEGIIILHALWGDLNRPQEEERWFSVAEKVQALVKDDKLEIKEGWEQKVELFKDEVSGISGDPAPNIQKGLLIIADYDGDIYYFRGNEAEKVSFPDSFTKITVTKRAEKGDFDILKGVFGNLNSESTNTREALDVSRNLRGRVKDGKLLLEGEKNKVQLLNVADPKWGWFKGFSCLYMDKNILHFHLGTENSAVALPSDDDKIEEDVREVKQQVKVKQDAIEVLAAYAGDLNQYEGNWEFIAEAIQATVEGDKLEIPAMTSEIFGKMIAEAIAGGTLGSAVGVGVGTVAGVPGGPGGMMVGAGYGAVAGAGVGGAIGGVAGLGKGIEHEQKRFLGMMIVLEYQDKIYFYRSNNTEAVVFNPESESFPGNFIKIDLPKDAKTGLHILKAGFGNLNAASTHPHEVADVAEKVSKMLKDNTVTIEGGINKVDKSIFGVDPMKGWRKGFYCLYVYDGLLHLHLGTEDAEVNLPNDADRLEEEN